MLKRIFTLKHILNLFALLISISMIVDLFFKLGRELWICIIIGTFIDVSAQYMLAVGKQRKKNKIKWGNTLCFMYLVYVFIIAVPSVVVFSATSAITDHQYNANNNAKIKRIEKQLLRIENDLEIKESQQLRESGTLYGDRSKLLDKEKVALKNEQRRLEKQLEKLQGNSKQNALNTLENVMPFPIKWLMTAIFIIITAMVYLTLNLTSWDLKDCIQVTEQKKETPVEKKKFTVQKVECKPVADNEYITFIQAAIKDSGALRGNSKISELTGIPAGKCQEYREKLDNKKINNQYVISKVRGGSRVNFSREEILNNI